MSLHIIYCLIALDKLLIALFHIFYPLKILNYLEYDTADTIELVWVMQMKYNVGRRICIVLSRNQTQHAYKC